MVHAGALPGTPFASETIETLVKRAAAEAKILADAGFDALILENMHDRPYVHGRKPPEIVAAMTVIAHAVRTAAPRLPLGIQVLSGGNHEALAICLAVGGSFIRCENFVFSHVADEGLLVRAEAGELLRYRRAIGAEHIAVYCDIKKKHASHAITGDVTLAEAAEACEFFGADGVIVTGRATGRAADVRDVSAAREATKLPVLVGSGVSPDSVASMFEHADALIVGSSIKKDGHWAGEVDRRRCRAIVAAADKCR